MPATVLELPPTGHDPSLLEAPARILAEGGLVAFPTETGYAIAANAQHPPAIDRLSRIRGRPSEREFTHCIADLDDLARHVPTLSPLASRIIHAFWPGPLTLVLPGRESAPVAVRFPSSRIAHDLIRMARVPIVAPGAGRAGAGPSFDPGPVIQEFGELLDLVIAAGPSPHRSPSTVAEVKGRELIVRREGAIPAARLRALVLTDILFVCTGNTCRSPMAEAIARALLARRVGVDPARLAAGGYRIRSAGTAAYPGGSSTPEAEEAVRKYGGDLEEHASQPLTPALVEEADHIFTMTEGHRATIERWMPECASKVQLLDPAGRDVEDPIGGTLEQYRATAGLIHDLLVQVLVTL